MKVDQKILDRLNELISLGNEVISTQYRPKGQIGGSLEVNDELRNQWFTSCLSLFSRVFGSDSDYYNNLKSYYKSYSLLDDVERALGVLKAAKEDYEKESIFELRTIIEAELFDDFLEQAEYLLESGYIAPAAVIAGSVLEDGLRKLCLKKGIALSSKPKLDRMNSELAKKGVYNKLVQKKITWLAGIRNSAAHGKWNEFKEEDVVEMIKYIRSFMAQYYS